MGSDAAAGAHSCAGDGAGVGAGSSAGAGIGSWDVGCIAILGGLPPALLATPLPTALRGLFMPIPL